MGILDSIRKSKIEKKEKDAPVVVGPTLDDVMQDPERFHLFGEMLKTGGSKELSELAERMAAKNLDQGDFAILEKQRKIFNEKMNSAERVEKWLTKENIMDLARNHPSFKGVIGVLDPEKVIEVIQSQLKGMSVTDEARFKKLLSGIDKSESFKNGAFKKLDEDIEKFLKDKKISPQEYKDAIAIEDEKKKAEALEKLADRTNTDFKKAINFLSRGKWGKDTTLSDLHGFEASSAEVIAELDNYQKSVGATLFASLNSNESMRKAMSHAIVGEEAPQGPKKGFRELRKDAFDEAKIDADWENEKKRIKPAWSGLDLEKKKKERNRFISEQVAAHKVEDVGGGFWARIFATLFDRKIEDHREDFKL